MKQKLEHKIWQKIFSSNRIVWQRHALKRMDERNISQLEAIETIQKGLCIEFYPGDYPLPSALFSANINNRWIHVVASIDVKNDWGYIITVYEPDLVHFKPGFLERKRKDSNNEG